MLPAVKLFLIFLVIRHLSEVCALSGCGMYRCPPHYRAAFAFSDILYPHSLRCALRLPASAYYEEKYVAHPCSA
ncbi:MAG: hypothetical protein DRI57_33580 [Deltaproteobacteria bacterium]|nr:MAG: hypothetical protein DRI57_33580 [Deltaproteobacteria bacterium]